MYYGVEFELDIVFGIVPELDSVLDFELELDIVLEFVIDIEVDSALDVEIVLAAANEKNVHAFDEGFCFGCHFLLYRHEVWFDLVTQMR
mmetsp:Transcript_4286/g.6628  ORF Transcript_4286/g.6628 Transcript_4286/m.6628 type:complete len:89 (-) Transcript_4286:5945-6211(-)